MNEQEFQTRLKIRLELVNRFRESGLTDKVDLQLRKLQGNVGIVPDNEIIYRMTYATVMTVITELFLDDCFILKTKEKV